MGTLWGLVRYCAGICETTQNNGIAFSLAKNLQSEIFNWQKRKMQEKSKSQKTLSSSGSIEAAIHQEEEEPPKVQLKEDYETASEGDEVDPDEHIGG